jgi:hypothetical protein
MNNNIIAFVILLSAIVLYNIVSNSSTIETLSNNAIPSCACIYDIDSTLTTGGSGKNSEIAIDSRASAESCIKAGCAIGVATGGTHCTDKDTENCSITKYALGFNILNPEEVKSASEQLNYPIITGKDWIVANWNKANAMESLSSKLSKKNCGILLDDNVLQSCGQCDAYTSESGCPAPWGSSKSNLDNPDMDNVKKAYSCSFDGSSQMSGNDYAWVPARPIVASTPAVGLSNEIWNEAVETDVIQNLGSTCSVKFQSIKNPVLKSYIPPKKQCDWENTPPKCANDDDCSKWATTNCKKTEFTEQYCKDNGFCHFKT